MTEPKGGRRPGPYTFTEARQLAQAAWARDAKRRNWVAATRSLYRTGRLNPNASEVDLTKPLWDRTSNVAAEFQRPNFARGIVDVISQAVAGRLPDASFDPGEMTPEAVAAADWVTKLVMGFVEDDDVQLTMRQVVEDSSTSGSGFGHVRWLREVRALTDEELAEAKADAIREAQAELAAQGIVAPDDFDWDEVVSASLPTEVVITNRPTFEYVSPANVLVPSDATDSAKLPWYGIVRYLRLSVLRADDTLDQEAVEALAPAASDAERESVSRQEKMTGAEDTIDPLVKVIYFYDRTNHRLLIFGDEGHKPLFEGDNPNETRDSCLIDIRAYRDGEHFFGFGDLEGVAGLLEKVALAVEQQVDNLDRQGPIWAMLDGTLSSSDEAAVRTAQANDIIKFSPETWDNLQQRFGDQASLDKAITNLGMVEALSADVYQVKSQLLDDANSIAGVTEFMLGGMGPSRASGTAAAAAEGWTSVRLMNRSDAVNRAYRRVIQLFLALARQYLTETDVVRLVGADGASWEDFVEVQHLSYNSFVRIRTGSLSASNPAARAQRGERTMMLADQLEDRGYDVEGLRELALRDMGIDPRQVNLRKLPAPEAPAAPGAMPPMPGMPPDGADPFAEPGVSTQDQMGALGGPPLPGDTGDFAFS